MAQRRRFVSAIMQNRLVPVMRVLNDRHRTMQLDDTSENEFNVTLPKNWQLETAGTAYSVSLVAGAARNVWKVKALVHNIAGQMLGIKNPGGTVVMTFLIAVN